MTVPVKKFGAGAIQVAIWQNEGKEGINYNTVSIQKNYKDKNDEWKSSSSMKANDIPKAILALQKAYEYLTLKEAEAGEKELIAAIG
ncbi:MAG: hypothetical protein QGI60_04130 [archaeon]|jgi:hypothetical protein|nr:hypothetical protein [archaeon]